MGRVTIIYILMMLCVIPCIAQDQDKQNRGPLPAHANTIFQLPSTDFIPNSSLRVKQDSMAIHNSIMLANIYNNAFPDYIVDAEYLTVNTTIHYGLTDKWQIGLNVPMHTIGGGILDGPIDTFHNSFGLNGNNREMSDRDQFQTVYGDTQQSINSEIFLGNITLFSRYQIKEADDYPGFFVGLKAQLPTGMDFEWLKHDKIGVGVECATMYEIGDFYLYVASSMAHIDNSEILWQPIKSVQYATVAAIDYRIEKDWSLILQYTGTSGAVESLGEYAEWSHELSLGTRIQATEHVSFEAAILENLVFYNNSADVGFYIGITFK